MIWLYTGTPGSGKSYHAVKDMLKKLKQKYKNRVISNFNLDLSRENIKYKKNMQENFIYVDNSDLTVKYLINFSLNNHKYGVEGQTLVVIDEAQIIFNSRAWQSAYKERMEWIKFFSQHRKYGYNFILITQFDRMLDKQIRSLVEYEVSHMKVNNFFTFLPTIFLCIERWYGQKMKVCSYTFIYSQKIAFCYNSYATFEEERGKNYEFEERNIS